jgi:hypothetical protein
MTLLVIPALFPWFQEKAEKHVPAEDTQKGTVAESN